MKQISILLSCFNGSELVESYIDSLLHDSMVNTCTLIAVDFPFSHRDPIHVRKQLERFPDLVYLPQETNCSLYDAWNLAIKAAQTPFVGNLNLDDRVSADYYALAAEFLESHKAAVFSSTAIMTSKIGDAEANPHPQSHFPPERLNGVEIFEYFGEDLVFQDRNGATKKRNPPHCAPVWRKSLHASLGWFDSKKYDFCADYAFWLRVGAAGHKFILLNRPKTIFYAAVGTASDRLMHSESESILQQWEKTFPPISYKETHLGRRHDVLHHCMNFNAILDRREYWIHLRDLVSIVVTAHNQPDELSECLESIRTQSYSALECIVVIDGDSTGRLKGVVENFSRTDSRFRAVHLERNVERNYARNVGLTLAAGEWICFADGDDLLTGDSLERRVNASRTHPDSIAFGGLTIFSNEGILSQNPGPNEFDSQSLRLGWPHHCTLLIPRKFLTELAYPASKRDFMAKASEIAGEDVWFMSRLLKSSNGGKFVNCGSQVYKYRRYLSSSYAERHISISRVIGIVIREFGAPRQDDVSYQKSICQRALGWLLWRAWNTSDIGSPSERSPEMHAAISTLKAIDKSLVESAFRGFLQDIRILDSEWIEKINAILPRCLELLTERHVAPEICNKLERLLIDRICALQATGELGSIPEGKMKNQNPADGKMTHAIIPHSSYERLLRFKNRHKGKECVLMCNGPSLKEVDFKRVDTGRLVIFGLNKIFLGFDLLGIKPNYIVAVNKKVIEQSAGDYRKCLIPKFISNRVDFDIIPADPMTFHLNTVDLPKPCARFSRDIVQYVNEGWTVTHAALQIIYYMGFSKVYIVGMDHRFSQHVLGQENKESVIAGDDKDHFHPGYFGHGQKWDFPDLKNSEISYQAARKEFALDGREILDCTIGGACEIFDKGNVELIYR
ncbi:MAG TPA: glycosyltransferase [Aromatoleum sp.]|uniref:glycosyltransferase n=1 Tax=Aromatoleum sp. TaxID=2307007 RepID=UPI002B45D6EA|nr:glycosyltransferase [Aromatoleum sp.]HJV25563.1 glycosyltransferase [Aromatoleum sp.]